tara:strand:+ start:110 stop:370 length:261 start_codon:yes stop_codon:yes gene_type:complete
MPAIVVAQDMNMFRAAYEDVAEALEVCEESWFASRREEALETISDRGFYLGNRVNPLSPDFEEQVLLLELSTEALRRCMRIVYPSE